jgi:TonB-dependent starch-binding outer membrane protein SusC
MRKLFFLLVGLSCVAFLPEIAFSQNQTIAGKITDAGGSPVAGATIQIKGTSRGTTTDAEGNFKLAVTPNTIVTVTFTGFVPRTFRSDELGQDVRIRLEEDVAHLDEVVVTGLATTVKRRNLANAVATISSKELNEGAPAQTFDAALEGKIPGAYINSNSGSPGGGVSVKLRGVTSVYGNTQPLYVVDGVFVDNTATSAGLNTVTLAQAGGAPTSNQDNPSSRIADIRPEDIENIEILKGASAAAVYGSRAAAGVIIITTKKGRQGRTKVTFSQDLGEIKVRKLLGVRQFTAATAASLSSDSATSAMLAQQFTAAQASGQIYDYEKEIYGNTGFARNSVLSVSGGTEKTGVYFSVSTKDEGGIEKNTGYDNTAFRLNIDQKVGDNIKLGVSANYINSSADRGLQGNDNVGVTTGIALSSTPDFAQLHPDAQGNYPDNPFAAANPLQTIALMRNNEGVNRFITGVKLEATLQKSLISQTRLVGLGGFDFYNLETQVLFPATLQWQAINKGTSIQGMTRNLNTNYIASVVNTLTPSDRLSFTTSAGLTQETGNYNNLLNVATQVIAGQSNVDQAGALNATQLRTQYQNNGIFLQEEANIDDVLLLTGGGRLDESSNNGNVGHYYFYPKAGLSWNLTKMGWLDADWIDNFKLRAAYGQANNVPAYGSKFTALSISNIAGNPGVLVNSQEGQPNIEPERQEEFETGADFSMLKGRLGFEVTYYSKIIDNFLMQSSLPASSGYSSEWVNAGNLRNRGVEIGMNARPVQTRNITWNTSVNFWLNRSLVTLLTIPPVPQGSFGYVIGSFQIQQGQSATQIVGLNGAGGVSKLGDAEPTFQMSTYNEITFFNNLSLRFLLHWKQGGQNVDLTTLENDFGGTAADYDKVTNKLGVPNGLYNVMQVGVDAHEFVQNSGYVRLREIGLYYSFIHLPSSPVKGLRVGVSLNNYLTFTKYPSYDPEVSNFGTGFSSGVDVDPYPASKRAAFHLSVDF